MRPTKQLLASSAGSIGGVRARLRIGRGGRLALKTAVWSALAIALFGITGFFIVPPIAKHYLAATLTQLLGREVTMQAIHVNPFKLTASIDSFSIKEPGADAAFVSFEEIFVKVGAASVWRRAPIVDKLRLQRPYVHVVRREDGSYNFSDLLQKLAKAPPSAGKSSEPARFALNNIQLTDGRVDFEDRPKAARHTVTELNIAIPFLSNLPYLADELVQPSFSARVNGAPFALHGRTKPFKESLETQVAIDIDALDVPRYMEYVPVELGFKIPSGSLDTRLTASFVRDAGKHPALVVAGNLLLQNFALTKTDGRPLARFSRLTVPIESASLIGRELRLGSVALEAPEVYIRRSRDGSLNWMSIVPRPSASEPDSSRKAGAETGEAASSSDAGHAAAEQAVRIELAELRVESGQVHIADEALTKPFRTDLTDVRVVVQKLALPQSEPAPVELSLTTGFGDSITQQGSLLISPLDIEGTIALTGARPRNYSPYYADFVSFDIADGSIDLSTHFHVAQTKRDLSVRLDGLEAALTKLRLRKRGEQVDFLSVPTLAVRGVNLDLRKRAVQLTEISGTDAKLHVVRERDGTIDLTQLTPRAEQGRPAARAAESQPARADAPAWQWQIKRVSIDRYGLTFEDRAAAQPVTHVIEPIKLAARDLSSRRDASGTVDLEAGINKTGRVQASGPVSLNPLAASLKLNVEAINLVPLEPYFADKLNILVTSGEALVRGNLGIKASDTGTIAVTFNGDAGVSNFASVDKAESADFLKWKSLFFTGVDTATQPFALRIQEIALSDFFSRLIVYSTGQLNVQSIVVKDSSAAPADAAAAQAPPETAGAPAPRESAAPPPIATAGAPSITIGKVTLQGGNVAFTDLFVRPNYSANLTEIGGAVTGLSSQLDTTADVDLRGRFAKTAPMEIKGRINPLVKNLYADIHATVRDIELGPFTPYSAKYIGYGIEKGKMSFDVTYKIENRKLAASNRLTLDQLTFGEKVDSATATKLPVLLAVSLLQDRNGVIDVNLPISGSLDDPKFSVGGIVLQIIFNLIEKAVTAPFALIGSMFGGAGEELAYIDFEPGRAALNAAAEDKLVKLQKALTERPKLKLDVTGRADPDRDREGLLQYKFDQQIKSQKLKDLVKGGASVASLDDVKVAPEEYETYLKRAYKEAKFPKPRNLIGLPKSLPREEMEKLILTNIQVGSDDLAQLANQRAQAAKDFITRGDQVPVDRVFLLAPRIEPAKADAKIAAARVDFALK